MNSFYDQMKRAGLLRPPAPSQPTPPAPPRLGREARAIRMRRWHPRPYRVLTVSSNKGGVGKTTLAANLAVYLRALREDLPVLALGLDDQSLLDRLFAFAGDEPKETVATGLRAGSFASAVRLGEYGVHYVPSDPAVAELKGEIHDTLQLQTALDRTGFRGLVILDTKSDLEILTRNAIAASDLTLVPVRDHASLHEADKTFALLERWQLPRERARIVLAMVDRRVKYREGEERDVLALLLGEIRRRGHPLLRTFVSSSPKIESLWTNPEGRARSILHGARTSLVHRQMVHLAHEVLGALDLDLQPDWPSELPPPAAPRPRASAKRWMLGAGRATAGQAAPALAMATGAGSGPAIRS